MSCNIPILVTSAGVASAVNVIKSLRLQKELSITIIASDTDKLAPGLHLADYKYVSPEISSGEEYLEFLLNTCRRHDVKAIFPCYSKELVSVSQARYAFKEIGVNLLLPGADIVELCDDKIRMGEMVSDIGIPVPENFKNPSDKDLPLFSKLTSGSSSKGACRVDNIHMLKWLLNSGEKRVYQEYIEGEEYTVDVLCNKKSDVVFSGPRKRIETKAGQSVKGMTVHESFLDNHVRQICSAIGFIGVCNVQFIRKGDNFYFIEFNPRYAAGGLMLTVHAGANLPLAALKMMLDFPVNSGELKHKESVVMTRYWEEIIVGDTDEN